MRVVIPEPVRTMHVARDTLDAEGVTYELRPMVDDLDYGRLMRELWEAGEEFCIVEHDIRPAPGQVAALDRCPDGILCGYDYPGPEGDAVGHALGLTRFSAELILMAPDAPLGWGDHRALYRHAVVDGDGNEIVTFNREGRGELLDPGLQWDLVEWATVDAAIFDVLAGYDVMVNQSVDEHAHTFHVHGVVEHARLP